MTLDPHAYPTDELVNAPWLKWPPHPDNRLKQPPGYREWPELHGA